MLLAERGEALLLGDGVDVCADDEGHKVEEGDPGVLGKELLRKGQAHRRGDPAHAHDLPEANANGGPHLVVRPRAGDESHGNKVHRVLDGCDLEVELARNASRTTKGRSGIPPDC